MVIIVKQRIEPLTSVAPPIAALVGSGVVGTFTNPDDPNNPDPFSIPPTKAIEVVCDDKKAGYAKAGFYAAGFTVQTATGATHDPGTNDPVTLTVTPSKEDSLKDYPMGIGQCAVIAAKALCGAFVTRPIGSNSDS